MAETAGNAGMARPDAGSDKPMPAPARWVVVAGVVALVGGAAALLVLRGEALMLDLSAMAGRIFCL